MTTNTDAYEGVLEHLDRLDLAALSFVQLRRLHKLLADASIRVDEESLQRADDADDDSSGDTVRVPSPSI